MNSNPMKVKTSTSKFQQDDSCNIDETHSGTKCALQNRNPFLYRINKHEKLTKSEPIRADSGVSERKGREEKRKREMGKKMGSCAVKKMKR
jgi:hypothetical protein